MIRRAIKFLVIFTVKLFIFVCNLFRDFHVEEIFMKTNCREKIGTSISANETMKEITKVYSREIDYLQ